MFVGVGEFREKSRFLFDGEANRKQDHGSAVLLVADSPEVCCLSCQYRVDLYQHRSSPMPKDGCLPSAWPLLDRGIDRTIDPSD